VTRNVAIIGAGIVGVTAALALQRAGFHVTLFDRDAPGQKASRWNAGVLATSSLVPLNNPGLLPKLSKLALGQTPGFRMNPVALWQTLPWAWQFVRASQGAVFEETVKALHHLIGLSRAAHLRLLDETGSRHLLVENGWLQLFETEEAFAASQWQRRIYDQYKVTHRTLDANALRELEPSVAPLFARALLLEESAWAIDPHLVLMAYFQHFMAQGGVFQRIEIRSLTRHQGKAAFTDADDRLHTPDHLVVATGPWSGRLLASIGLRLPMVSERGYAHWLALREGSVLRRPVYDTAGGVVASPRPGGIQISTGTELTSVDALDHYLMPAMAEARARRILPIAYPIPDKRASADRPSLPDSRPAIGPVRSLPGLWLACGHQHIGFSTAPGTADILAHQMLGGLPDAAVQPFLPERFGL
jgi:D-amino-acid dehydrogenase